MMAGEILEAKKQLISLQHLCVISIVNRLEQYSDEYLSLLPNKIRLEILRRLPVVDICRLEGSTFVNGLDTTAIWEELYKRHYSMYVNPGKRVRGNQFRDHLDCAGYLAKLKSKTKDNMKECCLNMIGNIILNDARPSGYWEVWEEEESDEEEPSEPVIPCTDKITVPNPIEYVPNDIVNYLVAVDTAVLFTEPSMIVDTNVLSRSASQLSITADVGSDTDSEEWLSYNALTWGKTMETDKPSSHYVQACQQRQYVPHRYSSMLDQTRCRVKDGDALSLLMTRCNFHPTTVVLNEYWVGQSGYPRLGRKNCSQKLLTDCLSEVTSLNVQYSCVSSSIDPISLILASKHPRLSSLSLSASAKLDEAILYLHDMLTGVRQKGVTPGVESLLVNLKELEISGYVFNYNSLQQQVHGGRMLATSVEKLGGLECLKIECGETYFPSDSSKIIDSAHKLSSQLIAFVNRPSFRSLTVRSLKMRLTECQQLILDFMAKPCSTEQTLHLEPVINDIYKSNKSLKGIIPAEKSYDFKSLHLITPHAPHILLPILKEQPSIHLKCLEVSCEGYSSLHTFQGVPKLYVELAGHSDLCIQTLVVREHLRIERPSDQQIEKVEHIFYNPFVRHLTISDVELPHYLEGLTRGLLKQANVKTLSELTLSTTDFGFDKERLWMNYLSSAQRKAFFNALFQLPQLEELSLSLTLNGYGWHDDLNRDLNEMYLSWKESSKGKHPKDLKLGIIYEIRKEMAEQLREMGANFTAFCEN